MIIFLPNMPIGSDTNFYVVQIRLNTFVTIK